MLTSRVQFTGLEFNPDVINDRWHRGIIPLHWHRYRFILTADAKYPVNLINRWMFNNIEGRWAIWIRFVREGGSRPAPRERGNHVREVNLAFENDFDGMTFVLADGKTEALKEAVR